MTDDRDKRARADLRRGAASACSLKDRWKTAKVTSKKKTATMYFGQLRADTGTSRALEPFEAIPLRLLAMRRRGPAVGPPDNLRRATTMIFTILIC